MKHDSALKLIKACELANIDASLREDYSGRFMNGDTTTGVVVGCTSSTLINNFAFLLRSNQINEDDEDLMHVVTEELVYLRNDNMGLEYILY